jgi:hypothetical protein
MNTISYLGWSIIPESNPSNPLVTNCQPITLTNAKECVEHNLGKSNQVYFSPFADRVLNTTPQYV